MATRRGFTPPSNDNLAHAMSDLVPDKYKGTDQYLDIVAWNIRFFHDRDPQRVKNVVDVLAALNADVFVFEEILEGSLDLVAQELGRLGVGNYTPVYGTTGGQQRVAIMHDIDWIRAKDDPVELFGRGNVLTGGGKDCFPRLPLHCPFVALRAPDVARSDGNAQPFDFQLVGLHLKSQRVSSGAAAGEDAEQRSVAADRLARWLTTEAPRVDADSILVGDWNKEPSADEWSAFHDLEQRGLAAFSAINNDSDISHLMFKSASNFGSRLDLGAMSMSAHDNLKSGTQVVRWKSLDDLLDTNPRATELKQLIRDLSRDVSDHMPVVLRFYFAKPTGRDTGTDARRPAKRRAAKRSRRRR